MPLLQYCLVPYRVFTKVFLARQLPAQWTADARAGGFVALVETGFAIDYGVIRNGFHVTIMA